MKGAALAVPRLGFAAFRLRLLFRGAFLLLVAATLALATVLLAGEKTRSYENYRRGFAKTQAEIAARLRHPAGQLALLNPSIAGANVTPLRPLLLPFGAIDFDDQNKAQQAVEIAGCSVRYADGSALCAAVGSNPYAGGFLYLVGSAPAGVLVARERNAFDMERFHRARVTLQMRDATTRWIAPFEDQSVPGAPGVRGRLTWFVDPGTPLSTESRPVRDFRGWLWQSGECTNAADASADCAKRTFFSIRLPVDVFREEIFAKPRPIWPPRDLERIAVRVELLAPGEGAALFDSNAPDATLPLSLKELSQALLPGEVLRVRKAGAATPPPLLTLKGLDATGETSAPWLDRLVRRLPADGGDAPVSGRETIRTAVGDYELELTGDPRSVERSLSAVATRVSWFVGAMRAAIALAWLAIEIGLIRRIAILTRRAAAVSRDVQGPRVEERIGELQVSDLRGRDELGILAGGLADLLQRVKEDVQRDRIRVQQERDTWHAVGHEIMSPLQSLMVLHASPEDASHRYIQRMQQAVRVLYGSASPSEAIEAAKLELAAVDLNEFLLKVAGNAHYAGVDNVRYVAATAAVMVRADEFSLEDVVTHILRNADRHREPGTPIGVSLARDQRQARVDIRNQGPAIDPAHLERVFEYGVSVDAGGAASLAPPGEHRGQGLFVVKTYMAKMGGTVCAANVEGGVSFTLSLPLID